MILKLRKLLDVVIKNELIKEGKENEMCRPKPQILKTNDFIPDYIIHFVNGDVIGISDYDFEEIQKANKSSLQLVCLGGNASNHQPAKAVIKDNQIIWIHEEGEIWVTLSSIQTINKNHNKGEL